MQSSEEKILPGTSGEEGFTTRALALPRRPWAPATPSTVAADIEREREVDRHNQAILQLFSQVPWEHPVTRVLWVHISRVQANDWNPNSVANQEMRLLHTSIRSDGYCVEVSTPILCADLHWRPAGDLVTGDEVISFDEVASVGTAKRLQRRYRTAQVLSNAVEPSPLVSVITDRGEVKVTPDHPFLAKRCYGKGFYGAEWIAASDLKPEDAIIYFTDPWEYDESREAGWLAGFLDGEGTCAQNQQKGHLPHVRLSGYQRPGPTAERMVMEMSKRAITKVFTVDRSSHAKWSSMVMARVDRQTEIMRLLGTVRPERLIKDAGRFWEGAAIASSAGDNVAVVRAVVPAGTGSIARLATSTRTYIGAGFAMHNTQPVVAVFDWGLEKFIIVDGFHRYTTMKSFPDIYDTTGGYLPVVVIDKPVADRMASTVRHNRARGKHSVAGMSNLVFQMLMEGKTDSEVLTALGMEAEELARLKHVTGYSKLYANQEHTRLSLSSTQIEAKAAYKREHPDETVPTF